MGADVCASHAERGRRRIHGVLRAAREARHAYHR